MLAVAVCVCERFGCYLVHFLRSYGTFLIWALSRPATAVGHAQIHTTLLYVQLAPTDYQLYRLQYALSHSAEGDDILLYLTK